MSFNGTSNVIRNSALIGGAIYVVLTFNGTTNFTGNLADSSNGGGAIFIRYNVVLTFNGTNKFLNNSARFMGGAIYTGYNVVLTFSGTSSFFNNFLYNQKGYGGAIYGKMSTSLIFIGTSSFIHNSAEYGGAIAHILVSVESTTSLGTQQSVTVVQ